jgi:hypothetical protein
VGERNWKISQAQQEGYRVIIIIIIIIIIVVIDVIISCYAKEVSAA